MMQSEDVLPDTETETDEVFHHMCLGGRSPQLMYIQMDGKAIMVLIVNFLRPFRDVHKKFLSGYIAICEFVINLKSVTIELYSDALTHNMNLFFVV